MKMIDRLSLVLVCRLSARIHLHALEGVERISAIDHSRVDVADAPDNLSPESGIKLFIVLRGVKRSEQTGVQRQHLCWRDAADFPGEFFGGCAHVTIVPQGRAEGQWLKKSTGSATAGDRLGG